MAKQGGLTPKQQRFVDEYLVDLNATQAAIRAGYAAKTAQVQSSRLLSNVMVATAISAAQAARSARTQVTADEVLTRLWSMATADANELVEYRRRCCRYCYGEGFAYQFTEREMDERRANAEPARYKGASGGRASGKSHFFAEEAVEAMVCDPSLRFVCIREVQRSLKFSAKSLVESKIRQLGVVASCSRSSTRPRSAASAGRGVMIFEGMQDHTADSIKSLEGFGRAWVEEAQSISQRSLDMLLPTIRADGSEVWFSGTRPADGPGRRVLRGQARRRGARHTTYLDNPFCPDVMRTEARDSGGPTRMRTSTSGWAAISSAATGASTRRSSTAPHPGRQHRRIDRRHGGELLVGMDFNVNPMSAVLACARWTSASCSTRSRSRRATPKRWRSEIRRRYPNRASSCAPTRPASSGRQRAGRPNRLHDPPARQWLRGARAERRAAVVDRVNNAQAMFFDTKTNGACASIRKRDQRSSPALQPHVQGRHEPAGQESPASITSAMRWATCSGRSSTCCRRVKRSSAAPRAR
jgi:hypothetical protein